MLGEEARELSSSQTVMFGDTADPPGDGHLEDRLREIHGDRCMIHFGLLLLEAHDAARDSGPSRPTKSREESIPSLHPTPGVGLGADFVRTVARRG